MLLSLQNTVCIPPEQFIPDLMDYLGEANKYKVILLKQIANELGIKVESKASRPSIIKKISTKISNVRGYDYLRNRKDEEH